MVVEFTKGGLMSVGTPFEKSKLGQEIIESGGLTGGRGSTTQDPIAEAKAAESARLERLRQEQLAAEAERKRQLEQQRHKDIQRAQDQLSRERGAIARRQRGEKGVDAFAPFGSVQSERDFARAGGTFSGEVSRNIEREKEFGRVDKSGLTQPERDVASSEQFFRTGEPSTEAPTQVTSGTVIPGSSAAKPRTKVQEARERAKGKGFVGRTVARYSPDFLLELGLKEQKLRKDRPPTKLKTPGKIATALDKKANQFLNKLSSETGKFVPEGKTKELLFEKKFAFSPTELAKFGFFSPAFVTTTGGTASLTKQGVIKPQTKTKFAAGVVQKGKVSEVGIISKTEIGGQKFGGLSRQTLRELDGGLSVGEVRGVSARGVKAGREVTEFRSLTAGKKLGKAKAVSKRTFDIEKELGLGVRGEAITLETRRSLVRRGGLRKSKTLEYPGVSVKLPKTLRVDLTKSEITGVVTPSEKGLFKFRGTTEKPTKFLTGRELTKTGIEERFVTRIPASDINVKGMIKVTTKTPKTDLGKTISTTSTRTKTPLSQTFQVQNLDKQIQKSITSQVSGAESVARVSFERTIPKTKPLTPSPVRVKSRPAPQTQTTIPRGRFDIDLAGGKIRDITADRFGDLGVARTRFDTGLASLSKTKQKTKQRGRLREEEVLKNISRTKPELRQRSKQATQLRTKQRSELKQRQRTGFFTVPVIPKPRPTDVPIVPVGFIFPPGKSKKKKGTKGRGREDIAITEGFTARTLGLKPIKIPKTSIPGLEKAQKGLGIRRRVIIK